jgi:hypothetical protein
MLNQIKPAGVLALGLIVSAFIGSYTFYAIRSLENTLVVTGSAKTTVKADSVKWSSSFTRTVTEGSLQSGYAQMARDSKIVNDFLKGQGIASSSITLTPIFVDQNYNYNPNGQSGPREYTLRQTVTVSSNDIAKIATLANNSQGVINQGVIFSPGAPEYYYSKLAELRVSLLEDAVKDAKARAEKLASSSGRSVGVLKSAASGVVQVLPPNSVEVSDYGQYDTSTIDKDVMITVKATFVVR